MSRLESHLNSIFARQNKFDLEDCAIIMATDSQLAELTKLSVISILLSHNCRIILFNLGLLSSEIEWFQEAGCEVVMPPELIVPPHEQGWQTFNKPLYIEAAACEKALWIDVDTVVTGDLRELTQELKQRPVFTQCHHLPNGKTIDPHFHWEMGTNLRPHQSGPPNLNAGVLALDKTRELDWNILQEWLAGTRKANGKLETLRIAQNNYWDQCVLQWVLEAGCLLDFVKDNIHWNFPISLENNWPRCAEMFHNKTHHERESVILHFAGAKKNGIFNWLLTLPPPALITNDDPRKKLTIHVLHHGPNAVHNLGHGYEPFDLARTNLPNEIAESRFFLSNYAENLQSEYIGVVSGSWDRKYGSLVSLHNLHTKVYYMLQKDIILFADYAPPTWVEDSDRNHPGMGVLIEELASAMGVTNYHTRTVYANTFVCHKSIWQDFLQFWKQAYDYCNNKYGLNPPFDQGRFDSNRKVAYLYERITMLYFASKNFKFLRVDENKTPLML